ncbi:MAG: hypothetical protein KF797_12715 [Flavobacteriales bacterium]|nr:hypothetical protein [Flavobacteriales bacterium]
MRVPLRYLNDANGKLEAVQVPVEEWHKLVDKATRYEQMMKMRSTLTEALREVDLMRKGKLKKQSLTEFLREL